LAYLGKSQEVAAHDLNPNFGEDKFLDGSGLKRIKVLVLVMKI
jgi:hypothetical protein